MLHTLENGKTVNIPDAELAENMKALGISKEEAIDMWLFDNDYEDNEEVDEMTVKAKAVKRYEKGDAPRKAVKKERKVDEEKKELLNLCRIPIEGAGGNVTNIKNEAEFSFTFGNNSYTIKLVKHRPPKK